MSNVHVVRKEEMHIKSLRAMVAYYDQVYFKKHPTFVANVSPRHRAEFYKTLHLKGVKPQVIQFPSRVQ
jgi:hypothetical protein